MAERFGPLVVVVHAASSSTTDAQQTAPATRTVVYEGMGGNVLDEEAIQRRNLKGVKLGGASAEALGENASMFEQALERDAKASFNAAGEFIGMP